MSKEADAQMVRILFVCLGNICRSPMAEAVFRHKVDAAGLTDRIQIDSAGTGDWHIGKPPHRGTRDILAKHGIHAEGLVARQVTKEDGEQFDYVVAMDNQNYKDLLDLDIDPSKLHRMLDYFPECGREEVPDPYYTGNFDEVYDLLDESCSRFLDFVRKKEAL